MTKMTKNGTSTTQNGTEQYEKFTSSINKKSYISYDYRTPNGKLFSCVASTLEDCRAKMHSWLIYQLKNAPMSL